MSDHVDLGGGDGPAATTRRAIMTYGRRRVNTLVAVPRAGIPSVVEGVRSGRCSWRTSTTERGSGTAIPREVPDPSGSRPRDASACPGVVRVSGV